MPTTSSISADSPEWWRTSQQTRLNPPSKSFAKLTGPQLLRGIHSMEVNLIQQPPFPKASTSATNFNTLTCTTSLLPAVPSKPSREESLDQSRLLQPAARLSDPLSFNSRHRDTLNMESKAFFRTKGALESYLEDAHSYRDFLVWQASHPRGNTRGNNPSNFKPKNDFYSKDGDSLVDTQRMSTSRLMKNRHVASQNSKASEAARARMKHSESEPVLLTKAIDPPVTRILPSPRSSKTIAMQNTQSEIAAFERRHHDLCCIENMTKAELLVLIEREGLELPGEEYYDKESGMMKKEKLKKSQYLEVGIVMSASKGWIAHSHTLVDNQPTNQPRSLTYPPTHPNPVCEATILRQRPSSDRQTRPKAWRKELLHREYFQELEGSRSSHLLRH